MGAKLVDLSTEQKTKYDFAINLKAARALSLTVPPSLLARADEVIERRAGDVGFRSKKLPK